MVNNSHEWCAEGVIPQIEFLQNIPAEIVAHWFAKYRQVGEFYIDSLTEEVSPDTEEYRILEEQGIQSLITAPLYNVDGSFKGFLGVDNPKEKTKETMVIRAVSNFVADFLEKNEHMLKLYEVSYFDSLVGMRNRHSYRGMLERLEGVQLNTLGVVFVDINGLKVVNDNYGHKQGDAYIKKVGGFLKELYGDDAFRIGGDEFVVMFTDKSKAGFETKLEQLKAFIARDEFPSAAIGVSWRDENCSLGAQIEIADRLMYKHKAEQYRKYAGKSELFKLKYHEASDN